jgi:N,N'-diacetylchitobiose phosphorylase
VPRRDPVRILRLRLTHRGAHPRTLSAFSYQHLVLGSQPSTAGAIETAFDPERDILRAVNPDGGRLCRCDRLCRDLGDERSGRAGRLYLRSRRFIGRHRDLAAPAAVVSGADLCGATGAGLDACFAQQSRIRLAPGETAECVFLLGECRDEAELDDLLARYRRANAVAEAWPR